MNTLPGVQGRDEDRYPTTREMPAVVPEMPPPLLQQPVLCLDCTGDTTYDPRDGTYRCDSCGSVVEEVAQ